MKSLFTVDNIRSNFWKYLFFILLPFVVYCLFPVWSIKVLSKSDESWVLYVIAWTLFGYNFHYTFSVEPFKIGHGTPVLEYLYFMTIMYFFYRQFFPFS